MTCSFAWRKAARSLASMRFGRPLWGSTCAPNAAGSRQELSVGRPEDFAKPLGSRRRDRLEPGLHHELVAQESRFFVIDLVPHHDPAQAAGQL